MSDFLNAVNEMNAKGIELREKMYEQQLIKEQRAAGLYKSVKNIEENTDNLKELLPMLSKSTENQEQILELMKQALAIGTAQNQEEADSKYRKFMNDVTQNVNDIEAMQKTINFGGMIYKMVNTFLGA